MKKTLLALSVLVAAGSVNAAEVYSKDGVTVSIEGAAEIQYFKGYTNNSNPDIRLDDGELAFTTEVEVAEGLTAIGVYDFEFEDNAQQGEGEKIANTELYAGFDASFGTITFGRQYTYGDDTSISEDYELNRTEMDFADAHGSDVIKYHFESDMFYAGIAHDLGDDRAENARSITDGVVGITVQGLDARVYYYSQENTKFGKKTSEIDGYNIEAVYSMDAFSAGASYGEVEVDNVNDKVIELVGTFTMDKNTFAAGATFVNGDDYDEHSIYANVTHKLHSNVKVYAEIGTTDTDKTGVEYDFGYLAGLEVKF